MRILPLSWASAFRILTVLLIVGVTTADGFQATGHARTTNAASKSQGKKDIEFQAIVDQVAAVPPEFGSDILIRLAESGRVASPATRMELLKKAFSVAAGAEQPVKRFAMAYETDTRSGFLAVSFGLNLDRLSLQSRVVNSMSGLDVREARQLLTEIQFPTLKPLGCEERLTYDVSAFYQTIDRVMGSSFTSKDKRAGRDVKFLEPYVSSLQSHAQIDPLVQLLLKANVSPSSLEDLANAFAYALTQLHGDEGSFAAVAVASPPHTTWGVIASLIKRLQGYGVPGLPLLKALREYLVSNFSGVQCPEPLEGKAGDRSSLPEGVTFFNQEFRVMLQNTGVTPIQKEELEGARLGGALNDTRFWQSLEAKRLLRGLQVLRWGKGNLSPPVKDSPEWSARLTDFLTEMEAWKPDNEPDFFCEKSILYTGLIDLVPTGAGRSKVIDAFVEFLEQNSGRTRSRIEWFVTADTLLSGSRATDDQPEIMLAFLNSSDPTLSLYARLKRWGSQKHKTYSPQYQAAYTTQTICKLYDSSLV